MMGSPYNVQSPGSAASGAANTATWWSLMENSDTSDDEHHTGRRRHRSTSRSRSRGNHSFQDGYSSRRSSFGHSSSRRSSAPLPQPSASPEKMSRSISQQPSRRSLGTPKSSSQQPSRRTSETPRRSRSATQNHQQHQHHQANRRFSSPRIESTALGPSLDEEDSEQKKIRWETPTTHRYQLADQPRLLEEKFLNVLDSMQSNMVCSHQNFEKPLWNLLEPSHQNGGQDSRSSKVGNGTADSTSQDGDGQSSDDSVDDSIFEDGPSVVHVSSHLPVFSESITASESLLSGDSRDSDEENERRHNHHSSSSKYPKDDDPNAPADSSQILDDLSGMESERRVVEYDNAPHRDGNVQGPIVVNNYNRPPVKIYSTSMPFEPTKEKKCIVSVGKLQDMHKARSDAAAAKKRLDGNKKGNVHNPPIADISVGDSNEISTMSASEDSYMYHAKMKHQNSDYRAYKQERTAGLPGAIPEDKGLRIESNAKVLFDNSFQDETRSCIPIRLQRKRRGADGATASSSSKSLGLRLISRSGDANNTSEKENDETSPYIYEYESGMNTYVAYFEISASKDIRPSLQVIEHPNPPLLPFGSNEVVVKIEASTISQSDCAIRRGEWWGGTLSLPRIPGVAFAGKIDQIHKTGRNSMQTGDQVLSLVCSGSNSRYVCIPRERLVKVPNNLSQDSAKITCLPEIYLSAFQALHVGQTNGTRYRKNSLSGKSIMFIGGASAFGQAVVELSVEAGASVVYATATKVKQFQRIIEMGGIPLSDNPAEWLPSINQSVDILIGCTNDVWKDADPLNYDHLNVLKKKGQLILLGGPGAPNDYPVIQPGKAPCLVDVFKILKRAHKHNVFENWERDMKQGKRDLLHLLGLLHKGLLKPKILERIPLSKVSKAEEIVEARRLHGVIICEPWIQEKQR